MKFLQKSQLSNSLALHALDENLTFYNHVKNVSNKISKSVGVMRRLHCQLPADLMVKLYYSLVYSHLTYALYWHGEELDVLMLLRLSVLAGEHANYSQIITIGSSLFSQLLCSLRYP